MRVGRTPVATATLVKRAENDENETNDGCHRYSLRFTRTRVCSYDGSLFLGDVTEPGLRHWFVSDATAWNTNVHGGDGGQCVNIITLLQGVLNLNYRNVE